MSEQKHIWIYKDGKHWYSSSDFSVPTTKEQVRQIKGEYENIQRPYKPVIEALSCELNSLSNSSLQLILDRLKKYSLEWF